MAQYAEALQRWRPKYVHAFPSALYPLVLWLRENGKASLLEGVRSVTLFSESVFDYHMVAFNQFFRCPVMVHYGHTERAAFAMTLPDDPRYHVLQQYGYVELLGTDGERVTSVGGAGEIVATSFDNLVMPFVRYRTGDYAVLGSSPNGHLPSAMVFERIEGRIQEYVVCSDHRLITVTTLGAAHIREFELCLRIQYEQFDPGRLTVRVVSTRQLGDLDRRRICSAIEAKTQGGCSVVLEEVGAIELTQRGKQRLLIQHLDLDRYLGASMSRS
jgi:phenylacetate-CoA ligase